MGRDSVLLSCNGFFPHKPTCYHSIVNMYKDWMDHHYGDRSKEWVTPKLFYIRTTSHYYLVILKILLSCRYAQISAKVQTDKQIKPHSHVLILFTGCKWITEIMLNFTGTKIDDNVIDLPNENLWLCRDYINELNYFKPVDFLFGNLAKLITDCPHGHFIASGEFTSVHLTILCIVMIKHEDELYVNDSKDWRLIFTLG